MPGASRVERIDDATVVVKEAVGPEVEALRAEGERLASAAHPGVVRLLSSAGDAERWELRTAHAGRPLGIGAALDARSLASIAVAIATTLADLHDMGIVHGRLRPSHIVIGPSSRPVICGLGPGDREQTPADDVGALGQIIVDQLAGDQTLEPIPERRWSRRRRWDGWARATLLNLAEQACADPPSRRPSARRFAAAMSQTFDLADPARIPPGEVATEQGPFATHDDPIEMLRRRPVEPTHRARAMPLRAAAGLVAIVLGLALVLHSSTSRASLSDDPTRSRSATATTSGSNAAASQPTPRPAVPAQDAPPAPRRCPGPACAADGGVTVDGRIITTPDGRFEVGRAGDSVVVGDWDCDGVATAAVLRPATGEVFVFPRWAGDAGMAVGPVRTVAGAAELEAVPLAGGCSALRVRTSGGDAVDITRAAPQ